MIDVAATTEPVPVSRWRRRRRLWLVLLAVVVVVVAGVVTAVSVSLRYLHAESLSTSGGGWTEPDNAHARSISAGPYTASVVPPRPGHRQTFELSLNNFSDVSQTVLGLVDGKTLADPRLTGEPETLQVSTGPVYPAGPTPVRYTSKPVTIPPGGQYSLRFTEVTARGLWTCGRSESITGLDLRVRVGMFTRTETVDLLDNLIMEIRSATPGC